MTKYYKHGRHNMSRYMIKPEFVEKGKRLKEERKRLKMTKKNLETC
jgi:uncharacterized protein with GYD domain